MTKCPMCGWENEDGVLYCDQCKSDLAPPLSASTEQTPSPRVTDTYLASDGPWRDSSDAGGGLIDNLVSGSQETSDSLPGSITLRRRQTTTHPSPVPPPSTTEHAPTTPAEPLQLETRPKLVVLRGEKLNVQYPIYPGKNFIGRTDEKPVDVDLENQEAPDRILCSRQHAVITFEDGVITIEDLNSLNGTFINRNRVHPGQVRTLQVNDVIQIGTVHLKVTLG